MEPIQLVALLEHLHILHDLLQLFLPAKSSSWVFKEYVEVAYPPSFCSTFNSCLFVIVIVIPIPPI
jgi:hypothetical protein